MAPFKQDIKPAEIVKVRGPYLVPGKLMVTEWTFTVPLQHHEPDGERIRLFARSADKAEAGHTLEAAEATKDEKAAATAATPPPPPSSTSSSSSSSSSNSSSNSKPWLFYLNGGPGGAAPHPQEASFTRIFLERGYRVMCLDQRGAGLSQTLDARTLHRRGPPADQAAYLKLFRADNIVRDFEAVRLAITADGGKAAAADGAGGGGGDGVGGSGHGGKGGGNSNSSSGNSSSGGKKISLLGQSFGGFCSNTYLSMHPEGLREVYLTGGLAPIGKEIDHVYTVLVRRAEARSRQYYEKFPDDVERIKKLVKHMNSEVIVTANGGRLTEARFRALGVLLGGHGGFTRIHNLVVRMENDMETYGYLTRPTMTSFEGMDFFDDAILYAVVHEIIYLDGTGKAPNWSAERQLKASAAYGKPSSDDPVLFTTEMITHDTFTDHAELRQLLDTAEILYSEKDWPKLYDEETLAKNKVPVFAAVYHDDLFVDFDISLSTLSKIKGSKSFITNRMYHDGIRSDTNKVMEELFALRDDTLD